MRDNPPNIQGIKTPGGSKGGAECARKAQRIARKCRKRRMPLKAARQRTRKKSAKIP